MSLRGVDYSNLSVEAFNPLREHMVTWLWQSWSVLSHSHAHVLALINSSRLDCRAPTPQKKWLETLCGCHQISANSLYWPTYLLYNLLRTDSGSGCFFWQCLMDRVPTKWPCHVKWTESVRWNHSSSASEQSPSVEGGVQTPGITSYTAVPQHHSRQITFCLFG